jgi:DNA-directed RNA polymerase specialized sigma24 family protein
MRSLPFMYEEFVLVHQFLTELKFGLKHDHIEITERAVRVLYTRFAKRFCSYALHQGLTPEDADDCVEDIFERILNSIESYDEVKAGGEKWMWTICKRIVIDKQRKIQQAIWLPDDGFPSQEADSEYLFERGESYQILKCVWEQLSESDRQELRRGKGRGPGRSAWHEAAKRFRELFFKEQR